MVGKTLKKRQDCFLYSHQENLKSYNFVVILKNFVGKPSSHFEPLFLTLILLLVIYPYFNWNFL